MSNPQPQPASQSALTLAAAEAYLIGLYVGAEAFLTQQVTRILKRMQQGPLGAATARQQVRQVVFNIIGQLDQRTPPLVNQVVARAVRDGGRGAGTGNGGGSGSPAWTRTFTRSSALSVVQVRCSRTGSPLSRRRRRRGASSRVAG
jgi:ABC-type methionine transport system permease subunit